jgi:hypothetical protein
MEVILEVRHCVVADAAPSPPRLECRFRRRVTVEVSSGSFRTLGEMLSTPGAASARIVLEAKATSSAVMVFDANSSIAAGVKSLIGSRPDVGAGALRIRW